MSEQATAVPQAAPSESAPQEIIETSENLEVSSDDGSESLSSQEENIIQDAIENGASEKEIRSMIKKFKLKVDGREVEREVDLSDENFIRNQLQLAEVSKKRMQETAELKKLYEQEVRRLMQNPWEVLQELGLDPDDLAERRLEERVQEMKKSPEQIEREKIQKELEEARREAQKLKEEKENAEFQRLKEQAAIEIEEQISAALDAHKTLPKSRYVAKRVADSMVWAMDNGFPDVTAEDVIPMVENEMRSELDRLYDELDDDGLEQFLGKKVAERLRTRRIKQLKTAPNTLNQIKPTTQVPKDDKKEASKLRSRDFFKKLGK